MQSTYFGSPRLSQAALSRSHFLRLAAGALFPFVGWRLPAALRKRLTSTSPIALRAMTSPPKCPL